jgi:hypothetical protein
MRRKKLLKPSKKPSKKRINRRYRNRINGLQTLVIPVSIVLSLLSTVMIIFLVGAIQKQPLVSPVSLPFTGSINAEDAFQSELEQQLKEQDIDYLSVVRLKNGSFRVVLQDTSEIYISSDKDLDSQISSLQYIMVRLTMEGKQFSRLDLRYDKPVIVFK